MYNALRRVLGRSSGAEAGFTLVELLVVVAVLGALAAVAVPNLGAFARHGDAEAAQAELHNVQTATLAMLTDSTSGALVPLAGWVKDMDKVKTTDATPLLLSSYLGGLDAQGKVRSGHKYRFTSDGVVTQKDP